jgi:hypothetical protein
MIEPTRSANRAGIAGNFTLDSVDALRRSLLPSDLSARLRDSLIPRLPSLPPLLPNWDAGQWLDEPARIALEEGIPMAYVPPNAIVAQLVALR